MIPGEKKSYSPPEPKGSEPPLGDEEYLLAKDLIHLIVKTIKSFRLYPADNPTLQGMKEQLFKRFQAYLEIYQTLILEIGEHDFSFKGKIVYEDRELKGSLPFLFYKDGLRELRFLEGIEEDELHGLTDIIIQRDNINEFEDDLITLIWEKDLVHIGYTAIDPFLEETSTLIPATAEDLRKRAHSEPMPASTQADFHEEASAGEFDFEQEIFGKEEDRRTTSTSVYFLTPEELESLRKEVEGELDPNFVFQVVDILIEILSWEKERDPFQDALRILQQNLDALLSLAEFARAKDLLNRIHIILNTYEFLDWQVQAIEHLLETLGGPEHTHKIGQILEKNPDLKMEEVSAYLLLLRPQSVSGLIKVLGDLSNSKGRRMLCDVICELGKTRIDLITSFMDDARWYLVRNIVYILGRIGQESSLAHIVKGYNHSEPRVRREAVQAAGLLGGSRATALIARALKDPDLRIRSMAAINLARVGRKGSLPLLLGVIQGKDFAKRDPTEVKAFFDAAGSIGSNEAIRPLQQILEQKSWFGGGVKEEVRLGAACSLALIGTPEARAVLEAGAKSREPSIRAACLEANRRHGI